MRVLRLEVSAYNVYITNQTVNMKEENPKNLCLNYIQEFVLWKGEGRVYCGGSEQVLYDGALYTATKSEYTKTSPHSFKFQVQTRFVVFHSPISLP
jgi:hypothetical protein